MTVNLYDVEDRELVLVFYDDDFIDICRGAERWEHGRVLELLWQVSDGERYDRLDLSGLITADAEGMSRLDMDEEMDRLSTLWGVAAMAYPGNIVIDLTSVGTLSRYALGYDC